MFKNRSGRASMAILLAFLVACMGSLALAQSAVTGAVGGAATDPNNAAVANATVTLLSMDTNKSETATTDSDGRFRFTNLIPGSYTVTISASGFSEFKQEKIIVEVGRVTNVDAIMRVGGASSSVDIIAGGGAVNLDSKDFTTNINQTAINSLPINGRRWSDFALLTPSSVPDGSFGLISFRGISGLLNNNTVDGGDNNQAFFSEERGRTRLNYSISEAAIREFQVNTSNYSAEYGRSAGGVTNAVIKSGTNAFHGDGFYYNRNSGLGARPPLAVQSILLPDGSQTTVGIKPFDVRQQFGGTFGGPIVKDKLFFFFSYDQQIRNFPGVAAFSRPDYLNTLHRGQLQGLGLSNAQINNALGFLNSETGTVARKGDQTLALPKIDWNINSKNQFAITYNRLRWDSPSGIQTSPVVSRGLTSFGNDFVKVDWGTARLISTINPKLINEFRVQVARDFEYEFSQTPLAGEPRTSINGSVPDVSLNQGIEFGKATFLERPKYPDERREQFVDNVTYSIGANTLKFGFDIDHVHDIVANLFQESGSYSYSDIDDFIVDYANFVSTLPANTHCATGSNLAGKCYTSNFMQGFGTPGLELSTNDYGAYLQYDWKFRPRLTINLGLRYEYEQMPDPQFANALSSVIPNTNGRSLAQATSFLPSDTNNFGPRVGFAYDLTGDGKTSLRAGYGIYYGRAINSTIYSAIIDTGTSGGQSMVSLSPSSQMAPVFPFVLSSAPAGSSSVQFFAKNFGNPLIQQIDVSLQRDLGRNFTVSASYLGSFGQQLPTFIDRNLSAPTTSMPIPIVGGPFDGQTLVVPRFTNPRPLPAFGAITEIASTVRSQYNSLVLELNHRFAQSFQLQTSYTLSKATDDVQQSQTFTTNNVPANPFNPGAENDTRSNFDRRHKFIFDVVYSPRFKSENKVATALLDGWEISPIYKLLSGIDYDAGVSSGPGGGPVNGNLTGSGGLNRLYGLVDRNAFTGPTQNIFDFRLSRHFYIKENMNVEVLGEFFNLPNTVLVTGINSTMYNFRNNVLMFNNGSNGFGAVNGADSTLFAQRQIQLGIRLHF